MKSHCNFDAFPESQLGLQLGRDVLRIVDHAVVVDVVVLEHGVHEERELLVFVMRRRFVVVAVVTFSV